MSRRDHGLSIVRVADEAAREGAALVARLGRFVLVGQLDEDEPAGWSFSTSAMVSPTVAAEVGAGFDFERGVVYPLLKRTPTFPSVLLVGRASSNDVCIQHHSISKLHARIRLREDAFDVEDAGSLNGTFVGETRIERPVTVAPGDRLGFGTRDFVVHASARLVEVLARIGPIDAPDVR
ncbi:MAG: FHA domain-containing protein [Sandaracinaceae bacterium]|nr:FHA domain-containing protein [Sandaracinaceae bacterium]